MKHKFTINISENSESPLEALHVLSTLNLTLGRHIRVGYRPTLGIYNNSMSRLCDKHLKCCTKLEEYFQISSNISHLRKHRDIQEEIIDYLELSLYAAAEHIDDVMAIVKYFSDTPASYLKKPSAKKFKKEIDELKKFIALHTQAIKHKQARIRLFSSEITHNNIHHCLHGYFIEGVHEGTIGPNKLLHEEQKQIFSITSLMWEIICFALNISRILKSFLEEAVPESDSTKTVTSDTLKKNIISAARLPLYSFDDIHPFSKTNIVIHCAEHEKSILTSGIYGSIHKPWIKKESNDIKVLQVMHSYTGDGVSKKFDLVQPSKIGVSHWD